MRPLAKYLDGQRQGHKGVLGRRVFSPKSLGAWVSLNATILYMSQILNNVHVLTRSSSLGPREGRVYYCSTISSFWRFGQEYAHHSPSRFHHSGYWLISCA